MNGSNLSEKHHFFSKNYKIKSVAAGIEIFSLGYVMCVGMECLCALWFPRNFQVIFSGKNRKKKGPFGWYKGHRICVRNRRARLGSLQSINKAFWKLCKVKVLR
jgi:hypothetical protein